jgi:hypothetical protein
MFINTSLFLILSPSLLSAMEGPLPEDPRKFSPSSRADKENLEIAHTKAWEAHASLLHTAREIEKEKEAYLHLLPTYLTGEDYREGIAAINTWAVNEKLALLKPKAAALQEIKNTTPRFICKDFWYTQVNGSPENSLDRPKQR